MQAFATAFVSYIADGTVDNIQVGTGPCGEARYPSYPSAKWTWPGVGAFQTFDPLMLADLKEKAEAAGHSDWANPPTDAGNYNSRPEQTTFFQTGYQSDKGKFFLQWYQDIIVEHTDNVLSLAHTIFPNTELAVKISGIHWWFGTPHHAAELTAGYYQANNHNGYADYEEVLKKHGAHFDFTCMEMTDQQQASANAYCQPEELVRFCVDTVKAQGGAMSGENALERYDTGAYNQILTQLRYGKGYFRAFTYLRLGNQLINNGGFYNDFKNFVANAASI